MDKIICVGKNYLEHAKELGDVVPEKPLFFLKPPSSAIFSSKIGETLTADLPKGRGAVHYECEIVLKLDPSIKIQAVTLGLDLTLRELQADLKKKGHPWEISKVFPASAIIGSWIQLKDFPEYLSTEFTFSLNGQVKQFGRGEQMRSSPEKCIEAASEVFPMRDGDLVFTGTPAGVGALAPGDIAELKWDERVILRVNFK